MKLSELKKHLQNKEEISFVLPDGNFVPAHFHVTEVGKISKHYIDCGGTVRREERISLQLWNANDFEHRLYAQKLIEIIELSEKTIGLGDFEIEVEFQGLTINKFGLDFNGTYFMLTSTTTACLAEDACGIEPQKPKIKLSDIPVQSSCCDPSSGCC